LWDDEAKSLLLARDPLGIKPLYYASDGRVLRFASQLKALEAGDALSAQLDPAAVAAFLLWGSIPEPATVRAAIRALPAGHYLLLEDARPAAPRRHPASDPPSVATGIPEALAESVAAHLVADVPIGVFLSAGLDSGLVAALAARSKPELMTLTVR